MRTLAWLCAALLAAFATVASAETEPVRPVIYGLDTTLVLPEQPIAPSARAPGLPADPLRASADAAAVASPAAPPPPAMASSGSTPLVLGPGDVVLLNVVGQPELSTTLYVADNGSIDVPLVGEVGVAGMEPAAAAQRVAAALESGEILVDPQVSLTLSEFRSQQVSVLGEVREPGRFPLPTRTTVLDALAQAGGFTPLGGSEVMVLRPGASGMEKFQVNVEDLSGSALFAASFELRGGDTIVVPKARRFYIYGEVRQPNVYRIEPGMTVMQALSVAGGLTERGSDRRIEIRRADGKGGFHEVQASLDDVIHENDVLHVRERIF